MVYSNYQNYFSLNLLLQCFVQHVKELLKQMKERRTVTHNTKLVTTIFVHEVILHETFRYGIDRSTSTHKLTCKNCKINSII